MAHLSCTILEALRASTCHQALLTCCVSRQRLATVLECVTLHSPGVSPNVLLRVEVRAVAAVNMVNKVLTELPANGVEQCQYRLSPSEPSAVMKQVCWRKLAGTLLPRACTRFPTYSFAAILVSAAFELSAATSSFPSPQGSFVISYSAGSKGFSKKLRLQNPSLSHSNSNTLHGKLRTATMVYLTKESDEQNTAQLFLEAQQSIYQR